MTSRTILVFLFVGWALLAAACTVTPPAPPPPASAPVSPTPAQIQVWDGAAMHTFRQDDPAFPALAAALDALLRSVGERARTFYPPPRFQEEIAPGPYFLADYGQVVTLEGRGLSFAGRRLVVAAVDGEVVVLAQTETGSDWSVYLPVDPDATARFLAEVAAETGVSLRPGSSRRD